MQRGQLGASGGQLVIGRDPQRVHLVVKHPNVSGATSGFVPARYKSVDLGSTSGTWISGQSTGASKSNAS